MRSLSGRLMLRAVVRVCHDQGAFLGQGKAGHDTSDPAWSEERWVQQQQEALIVLTPVHPATRVVLVFASDLRPGISADALPEVHMACLKRPKAADLGHFAEGGRDSHDVPGLLGDGKGPEQAELGEAG